MTCRLLHVTVDCRDPHRQAGFWAAVLDYRVIEEGDQVEIASWEPTVEALRREPMPSTVMFIKVPEDKVTKNRLHLDVIPIDVSQDEEVERLIGLGARREALGLFERDCHRLGSVCGAFRGEQRGSCR